MDDTGEKIVFLAREILNHGVSSTMQETPKNNVSMSFKMLCLTTLLAATGGALAASTLQAHDRPLNRYERTEINALIFYATRTKNINETILRHEMQQNIGITSDTELTAGTFPAARRFLQEKAQ